MSPHIQQYMEYNNFMEDKLSDWDENKKKADKSKEASTDNNSTSASRILQETKD